MTPTGATDLPTLPRGASDEHAEALLRRPSREAGCDPLELRLPVPPALHAIPDGRGRHAPKGLMPYPIDAVATGKAFRYKELMRRSRARRLGQTLSRTMQPGAGLLRGAG